MGHAHHDTATERRPGPGARATVRRLVTALGVTAVVVLGAAPWASAATATVGVATSANFGTVLTDAGGFALYTLPSDHNGMSTCTGACVSVWPALTVAAGTTPSAGPGVPGTVAAVVQASGSYQVTYNGSPLYTFAGDTSPTEVSGNNVGGFLVVRIAASPTTPTSTPAPTTTPTTTPGSSTTPTSSAAPSSATTAPAAAPAGASAASNGGTTVAPATSPATGTAPTALAFTGPGPALVWMVVVGVGLVALSLSTLALLGDRSRLRRAALKVTRAGWWLVGR